MMARMLIIGCGNMGGAMLAGWLAAGHSPAQFAVLDPVLEQVPEGVALYRSGDDWAAAGFACDTVLLGFKPQQLASLAEGLQAIVTGDVKVCSLLAGITLDQLGAAFPQARGHIRVMPNLAARINKSPVILAQRGLEDGGCADIFALFDPLGSAFWLDDETQFDLVTALAGSGPGFVYRFIDALAGAAHDLGLERAMADRLALTMVEGAAMLAARADISPAALADRVASPGGMTREGLDVLDDGHALQQLIKATLRATADKGTALSKQG